MSSSPLDMADERHCTGLVHKLAKIATSPTARARRTEGMLEGLLYKSF